MSHQPRRTLRAEAVLHCGKFCPLTGMIDYLMNYFTLCLVFFIFIDFY